MIYCKYICFKLLIKDAIISRNLAVTAVKAVIHDSKSSAVIHRSV